MSGTERRLAKVETGLSPKEAVLAWMAEAHACGGLRTYVASLQGAPDSAFPLFRLGDQMEASVRSALRGTGRRESEVWQAVRQAVRDAGLLYYLATNLNWRALEHRRANWFHLALVAEMLRGAVEREARQQLGLWWEQARDAAHTVHVQQGVVPAVAERYFDGQTPLFPEVAADVARQVREIERVIGMFNAVLGERQPPRRRSKRGLHEEPFPEPIDLEGVRRDAEPAIRAELALVVHLSKAEARGLIGEREQGYEVVGRHVWPTVT